MAHNAAPELLTNSRYSSVNFGFLSSTLIRGILYFPYFEPSFILNIRKV